MAAAPAPATPPLVLDAHADTLDHVVRAVARSGFVEEAVRLMLASPDHLHDPELLYRTRSVRGAGGATLLMRAVERCGVARAAEIMGACPTPATRAELLACVDDEGQAALHLACHPDRLDEEAALRTVELLLANGADPLAPIRHKGYTGWHAIHYAAQWSARLVQRLVQADASIDGNVVGDSTLSAAASARSAQGLRMIPQLVALGAREILGNEAIFELVNPSRTVVGAQPSEGEIAAALNALVSAGSSLTEPDFFGRTLLDYAAGNGDVPMVRAMLSLGAPAATSSLAQGAKHPELVRLLLAAGAPVNALTDVPVDFDRFERCSSPLMAAACTSALESVEALLAAGASVDLRDDEGDAALVYSVWTDIFDLRIMEALLAAGADVNARNKAGDMVLHFLAAHKAQQPWAADAAQLLLQWGADARAVDYAGRAPAQLVPVAQRCSELFDVLFEAAFAS